MKSYKLKKTTNSVENMIDLKKLLQMDYTCNRNPQTGSGAGCSTSSDANDYHEQHGSGCPCSAGPYDEQHGAGCPCSAGPYDEQHGAGCPCSGGPFDEQHGAGGPLSPCAGPYDEQQIKNHIMKLFKTL